MNRVFRALLVAGLALGLARAQAMAEPARTLRFQTADGQRQALLVDFGRGRPAPLLIVLHGALGTAELIQRAFAFDQVAEREGLVVVYPEGLKRSWNDGRSADAVILNADNRADDVGFIRRVVEDLTLQGKVDRRRVYLTGFSNGGHMVYRLVCDGSDLFAAGAVLAANIAEGLTRDCRGRPLPLMIMNGTEDALSRWAGVPNPRNREAVILSAEATLAFFRQRNGCRASSESALPDRETNDGSRITLIEGTGCRAAFRFYRINGGGHQAASLTERRFPPVIGQMLGNQNRDIEAAEEIWAFFKDARR